MTGIERLHKLIADIDVSADPKLWDILRRGTEGGWDCDERDDKTLCSTLAAIADQIKREQGGRVSRMRVLAVVTEMEHHVSGVEGMDDSPVALWARELRSALVARPLDPADDASVSAYDLLPEEERDAIAWVREHGGLSHVKDIYHDFRAVVERLGIEWSESELHGLMDTLDRRLMPEGCEWPRYEDGKPFIPGDGGSVEFFGDGIFNVWINGDHQHLARGERVKRPAVLAADGEPLEVGQTVWRITDGTSATVERLNGATGFIDSDGTPFEARYFTHQRTVLDADGVPIRGGDTVWDDHGEELVVLGLSGGLVRCIFKGEACIDSVDDDRWEPSQLTHQRPVLDADGVPIREGDTVWNATTSAGPFTVREIERSDDLDEPEDIVWCGERAASGFKVWRIADQLTHTKLEIDSWERIEEDAGCTATKHNERRGTIFTTKQQVARDIVRRCRALAERERGE